MLRMRDKKAGQDRRDKEVDKGAPQSKTHLKQASESKLSDTSTTEDRYELSLRVQATLHIMMVGGDPWWPLAAIVSETEIKRTTLKFKPQNSHVSLYFLKVVKQ